MLKKRMMENIKKRRKIQFTVVALMPRLIDFDFVCAMFVQLRHLYRPTVFFILAN